MKRVKLLSLTFVLMCLPFLSFGETADLSILLVEDNDNGRVDTLMRAITACGYEATVYDAITNGAPDLEQMSPYDLVLWYASTDGGGRAFWAEDESGTEYIEPAIVSYLDAGGMMWISGADILYDYV